MSAIVESILRATRSEALQLAERQLREALKTSEASPFLGQHDLSPRASNVIRGSVLGTDPVSVFDRLFAVFPAVTVAYLAGVAQQETGRDGEGEFYPHLEADIDHHLSNADRHRLHSLFRTACLGLGLPVLTALEQKEASTWYRIADYELQAGTLTMLLPVLAQVCLQIERERGSLEHFDPDGARSWQAGVIELLNNRGRRSLARVLDADKLAWHARAFARLAAGDAPATSFEARFKAAIDKARETAKPEQSRFGPPLSLIFNNDEILLVAPSQPTGWRWAIKGSWPGEVELRPGEELPVSTEDELRVTARRETDDGMAKPQARLMTIWTGNRLAVYDARSGRRVGRDAPAGKLELVSRQRFVINSAAAEQAISALWKKSIVLEDGEATRAMFADGQTFEVIGHARPQLDWDGPSVVELDGKLTFGQAPSVSVTLSRESVAGWGRELEVVLRTPSRLIARSPVVFTEAIHGTAFSRVDNVDGEFERLTATLVRRGEDRPLLTAPSAWIWPGLQTLADGAFIGPIPDNFDQGASAGVQAGVRGIVTVPDVSLPPELVFTKSDGGRYRIRLRRSGIHLELQEGAERRSVPIGSSVIDDGTPRFLRVFCDDGQATLALPHSEQPCAFASAPMRQVRLDTLSNVGEGVVQLWPGGDRMRQVVLATVTRPCAPVFARSIRMGGRPCLEFELAEPIGIFQLVGVDLLSGATVTLGTSDGLLVDHHNGRWRVQPDIRALWDGAWLLEVRAVLQGRERARPLRATRGDRFALLLIKQEGAPSTAIHALNEIGDQKQEIEVFRRVNRALASCWAECCWAEDLLHLATMWRTLGIKLAAAAGAGDPTSEEVLLAASGDAPPIDANASWVPLRHPIEVWPAIYATRLERIAQILEGADDEGARALSALLRTPSGDAEEKTLRHHEACRRFALRVERTARDGLNSQRLSHAASLCSFSEREARRARRNIHIPPAPTDDSEHSAIVDTAPSFFSEFALASSIERLAPGAVEGWLEELSGLQSAGAHPPLSTVGFLCRLGPELLAWHLQAAGTRRS